jgi:hypothetical protein
VRDHALWFGGRVTIPAVNDLQRNLEANGESN